MSDGSFTYDPLASDPSLNSWDASLTIRYRAVGHTGGPSLVGDWSDYIFTLDRVAPTISTSSPVDGGTYDSTSGTPLTISFSEDIDAMTVDNSIAWIESYGTATQPSQIVSATNPRNVGFLPRISARFGNSHSPAVRKPNFDV